MSTTKVQVHVFLPDTAYECCVNAHIHTNIPLDLISSRCITTRTKFVSTEPEISMLSTFPGTDSVTTRTEFVSNHNSLAIGLGTGLSIAFLLLITMVSIILNIFLIIRLRNGTATNFKPACTNV